MASIRKFILIPIGLPGMGKTTLSRFLHATSSAPFKVNMTSQLLQNIVGKVQDSESKLKLEFNKISYDHILTQNQKEYCAKHPEIGQHEAIDIIRGKADQDYLDAIKAHCNFKSDENQDNQGIQQKQLIYLDRNNTPDVWPDIAKTIKSSNKQKDYKTFLIVPSQHPDFEPRLY